MRLSELRKRIDMSEFSQLEEKIGYTFKDKSYLRGAMTHSSYSGGKNNGSNERLEFLGDSVLQITVSLYLYTNMTTVPEGGLTKLRASIVCENSLYNFAKRISLGDYILLGKGEEMTGGRERRSILADAFEALIAAIFLDGGMDEAQKFIMRFVPSIEAIKSGKVKLAFLIVEEGSLVVVVNAESGRAYFLRSHRGRGRSSPQDLHRGRYAERSEHRHRLGSEQEGSRTGCRQGSYRADGL